MMGSENVERGRPRHKGDPRSTHTQRPDEDRTIRIPAAIELDMRHDPEGRQLALSNLDAGARVILRVGNTMPGLLNVSDAMHVSLEVRAGTLPAIKAWRRAIAQATRVAWRLATEQTIRDAELDATRRTWRGDQDG